VYQVLTKKLLDYLEEGDALEKINKIIKGDVTVIDIIGGTNETRRP